MRRSIILKVLINICFILLITNNLSYSKYVIEKTITVANIEIDRTKPIVAVKLTPREATQDLLVTISSNEPISNVEGWEISEDKLTISKAYNIIVTEIVIITDLSGNETTIEINIQKLLEEIELLPENA